MTPESMRDALELMKLTKPKRKEDAWLISPLELKDWRNMEKHPDRWEVLGQDGDVWVFGRKRQP